MEPAIFADLRLFVISVDERRLAILFLRPKRSREVSCVEPGEAFGLRVMITDCLRLQPDLRNVAAL